MIELSGNNADTHLHLVGRTCGSDCLLEQCISVDHEFRSHEAGLNILSREQQNFAVA
jgi:hypothetical protein